MHGKPPQSVKSNSFGQAHAEVPKHQERGWVFFIVVQMYAKRGKCTYTGAGILGLIQRAPV